MSRICSCGGVIDVIDFSGGKSKWVCASCGRMEMFNPKQTKAKAEGEELAKLARDLVYLSGQKFVGTGIHAQALTYALKVLNLNSWSGSAKSVLKANFDALKDHVDKNKPQLVSIRKDRKKAKPKGQSKPPSKPRKAQYNPFVTTNAFLESYEWRKLRMEALKLYGPKCMCCGATPATGAVMNVDHIKPRKVFPELALNIRNLQILCHECNHGKGNWDMTDWR
jgi:5-methylcytosine-specific restriction endonuclease McrA